MYSNITKELMTFSSHKILNLYETPSEFYIQPVDHPHEALIIDRQTFLISLNNDFSINQLPSNVTSCLIYGIIGIKYILSCPHLLVITGANKIGDIAGRPIYCLNQANTIPFDPDITERQDVDQHLRTVYLSMLDTVLKTPYFYFSYEYDLTNSLQRNMDTTDVHRRDERFLWNGDLIRELKQCERYLLPLIHGFVSINHLGPAGLIPYYEYWTLVSRRSVKRAGTRFNCRGIDDDGNVANFVETEQILEAHHGITSFVQVRGSIPVKWSQEADYRYKPEIKVNEDLTSTRLSLNCHFDELLGIYGRFSVINLIDKRGHEGKLGHVFSQLMEEEYSHHPYHDFDFHAECAKMRWHRLAILLDKVEPEIRDYSFFACIEDEVVQIQTGVIRSNCIDSLDRTNVVQSMIAAKMLIAQEELLRRTRPCSISLNQNLFKNVWADNADILSIQYAGTPALKTDFTRTGKRTWKGQVQDGVNSLTRYVKNNFQDGYRQESIDFFLGNHDGHPRSLSRHTNPIFFIGLILLTFAALYLFNSARS